MRRFLLIEHILLRPVAEDSGQRVEEGEAQVPLLAGMGSADPWSLQLSLVFQDQTDSAEFRNFQAFVAQTLAAKLPAHLRPSLHWFGAGDGVDHWSLLDRAWKEFREKFRSYLAENLAGRVGTLTQLALRDARDRVIELLGLARCWPLRDIPLPDHLIVAPGTATEIRLEFSQPGVRYELRHRDSAAPILHNRRAISAEGTGGVLLLPTPPIDEDISYRVLAVKLEGAEDPDLRREIWLQGTIRVEEGVDPRLDAQILLPRLQTVQDQQHFDDARIADYNSVVQVELLLSQEGVSYELIDDVQADRDYASQTPLSDVVVGTSGRIVLTLRATASEDMDLRIRGLKAVGDPQNPQNRTAVLTTVLPLRVRANTRLSAALSTAILDYGASASLKIAQSQASVRYAAWARPTRDAEFLMDTALSTPVIEVLDGKRTIRIAREPQVQSLRPDQLGFVQLGTESPGNAGDLSLTLGSFNRDQSLLVQASKSHRLGALRGATTALILSQVRLEQGLAALVRPNPEVPLCLTHQEGTWALSGGEPGVYYGLVKGKKQLGAEVYFHQRDGGNSSLTKGINQIRVGVDLAVVADFSGSRGQTTPPSLPDVASVPDSATLTLVARRAHSGLVTTLKGQFVVIAAPQVRVEPSRVPAGGTAQIQVESVAGLQYSLVQDGRLIGTVQSGTGATLSFSTPPSAAAAPSPWL